MRKQTIATCNNVMNFPDLMLNKRSQYHGYNEYIRYLYEMQNQAKPELSGGSQNSAHLWGGDKDLEGV